MARHRAWPLGIRSSSGGRACRPVSRALDFIKWAFLLSFICLYLPFPFITWIHIMWVRFCCDVSASVLLQLLKISVLFSYFFCLSVTSASSRGCASPLIGLVADRFFCDLHDRARFTSHNSYADSLMYFPPLTLFSNYLHFMLVKLIYPLLYRPIRMQWSLIL